MAKSKSKSKKGYIFVIFILLIITLVILYGFNEKQKTAVIADSDFAVYMLDVGQGDCTFIDNGDKDIIIDAGPGDISNTIAAQLRKVGADDIEYMFVSHSDADHIGGADDIINSIEVKNVVMSKDERTTKTYKQFVSAMNNHGITPVYGYSGDYFDVGNAHIEILSPDITDNGDANENSLVMLITCNGLKYLFTGDADNGVEKELLSAYPPEKLDCDLLKVGHHGSKTSSEEDFLSVLTPDFSLISVGKDNSYGHPDANTLNKLNEYSDNVLRTDLDGTIVIYEKDGVLYQAKSD